MGLSPPLLHQWFLYPYGEARTTGGVEYLPELSPLLPAPLPLFQPIVKPRHQGLLSLLPISCCLLYKTTN